MRRIVVVGGSQAGVHAIAQLRQEGYEHEITLVDSDGHLPYDRPPLSKEALFGAMEHETLLHEPEWYEQNGVSLRLGISAVKLNANNKVLTLETGEVIRYDGMVIATGSRARRLDTGASGVSIYTLRTLDDAIKLRRQMAPGKHLLVVGAGFIGLEVASSARQLGLDVTVVDAAQVPLSRAFGDDLGRWFRRLHERNGVEVSCATTIKSMERSGSGVSVSMSSGKKLYADLIVVGIGASPAVDWLTGSGLKIGNGISCESDLRTSAPDVVAAGDVARWYNPIFDEEMRVEHWTNAVEQGRHAAATLLGSRDAFNSVPYFWTDQFDAKMRFIGRVDAADDVLIERESDDRLVALFGRDGLVRGAACINAPRQLALYRKAILDQVPWSEVAGNRLKAS